MKSTVAMLSLLAVAGVGLAAPTGAAPGKRPPSEHLCTFLRWVRARAGSYCVGDIGRKERVTFSPGRA